MNIYIVRHAEPDYSIDSLTEKGLSLIHISEPTRP